MMRTPTVVRMSNVTKKFGDFTALRDVSFSVNAGEIVGFVGANGAGKSTTIGALLGFITTTNGTIRVFDQEISVSNAYMSHAKIGYASGDMELPKKLTGRQYLKFVASQSRPQGDEDLIALQEMFKPQLDKKIGTLSRGNKQKIALIGAFMGKPELLVLDEPTSGLDPVMQDVFLHLVKEARMQGSTVFMSSHYLTEVADVCTRVILMRGGVIVEDILAKELLEKSGKMVRVVTGYKPTRPPKESSNIELETAEKVTSLSFVYKGSAAELQRWVASVKQLQDIEITEYNLEGAFKMMYSDNSVEIMT